jgi:hypothetical protein
MPLEALTVSLEEGTQAVMQQRTNTISLDSSISGSSGGGGSGSGSSSSSGVVQGV